MAEKKSFLLRLNQAMWNELEKWAADDFRSVNGQIESILHEAITRHRKNLPDIEIKATEHQSKEES